jgi:hypothetical protein
MSVVVVEPGLFMSAKRYVPGRGAGPLISKQASLSVDHTV